MNNYSASERTYEPTRAEKIMQAKAAFASTGYGENVNHYHSCRCDSGFLNSEKQTPIVEEVHERKRFLPMWMLRMLFSGIIFFLLVLAFHYNLSYKQYNKEWLKAAMADDSQWNQITNMAESVMKQIEEKTK